MMPNQDPWRDFTREQIAKMSADAYVWLLNHHGHGCWNQNRDTVHWRISDQAWTFLLLKFSNDFCNQNHKVVL